MITSFDNKGNNVINLGNIFYHKSIKLKISPCLKNRFSNTKPCFRILLMTSNLSILGVSFDNIFVMLVIAKSAAYLNLKPEIDIGERLRTKLYDKGENFNFVSF